MKHSTYPRSRLIVLCLFLGLVPFLAPAQNVTQSITVHPGWNAIWLEVQPEENSADAVFAGLPLASVWARTERASSVDFIQDASEEAFNEAGWLGWFPPSRPEAVIKTLFAVQANHPYLLKSTNAGPVTWNVEGRPALQRPSWVPDSLNLRGLPVDPANPPTFETFFRPSGAHYDASTSGMRAVYRLNPGSGQWELLGPGELVVSGVAYWIHTEGASDYLAPFSVLVDLGDGLDYGLSLNELNLRFKNYGPIEVVGSMRELTAAPGSALSFYTFSPSTGGEWNPLPNPVPVGAGPDSEFRLRLALRRQSFSGPRYESVLEIRDGAGSRIHVPVAGDRRETPDGSRASHAGLWVGSASISAVSEPHSASPTATTPARSPFNLRLLLHVDSGGAVRLLREVTQMWRDGTVTNNVNGEGVVDQPGGYVLITDDALLPLFSGAATRDSQSVGRRLSSAGYDFDSGSTNNYLDLSGTFAAGDVVSGLLSLPVDHPRNPFKHKYHPDHDNLTARFDGSAVESFAPSRLMILTFSSTPPEGPPVSDYGYNTMGGVYQEIVSGLHKEDIHVSGSFRLQRVSLIDTLNPAP